MSVVPPGGKPTMMRTGRWGQAACARAGTDRSARPRQQRTPAEAVAARPAWCDETRWSQRILPSGFPEYATVSTAHSAPFKAVA
jgi:hypothetical protein